MIRNSKHILKYNNIDKDKLLNYLFDDYKLSLIYCIDLIVKNKIPLQKRLSKVPDLLNIKHSQWKQIIYKQASEILRSTIKKNNNLRFKRYRKVYKYFITKNKMNKFTSLKYSELNLKQKYYIKPDIESISIDLDERIFNIKTGNTFDEFVLIKTPYFINKKKTKVLKLPIKHHKQSNKYKYWNRKKTIQLTKIKNNFYITYFYEKEENLKRGGLIVGVDIGYKKLLSTSQGKFLGRELEQIYNKISKKKRGSKNYNQLVIHKNNEINKICNSLNLDKVGKLVIEDLKNVKHKSKLNKSFMNKLQYWSYLKVINKLERKCQEQGVRLVKVSPAYTSQTCSKCKTTNKESRQGEKFICKSCSYDLDADLNAALNIRSRGIYKSSNMKSSFEHL